MLPLVLIRLKAYGYTHKRCHHGSNPLGPKYARFPKYSLGVKEGSRAMSRLLPSLIDIMDNKL